MYFLTTFKGQRTKIRQAQESELYKLKTIMDVKCAPYVLSAIHNSASSMDYMKGHFTITLKMVLK